MSQMVAERSDQVHPITKTPLSGTTIAGILPHTAPIPVLMSTLDAIPILVSTLSEVPVLVSAPAARIPIQVGY